MSVLVSIRFNGKKQGIINCLSESGEGVSITSQMTDDGWLNVRASIIPEALKPGAEGKPKDVPTGQDRWDVFEENNGSLSAVYKDFLRDFNGHSQASIADALKGQPAPIPASRKAGAK